MMNAARVTGGECAEVCSLFRAHEDPEAAGVPGGPEEPGCGVRV